MRAVHVRAACVSCICAALPWALLPTKAVAQGASDTLYHLQGRVVDGVTHQPIARALVVSGDRRLATLTGANGRFSIDVSVPASDRGETAPRPQNFRANNLSITLFAQRPGYFFANQVEPIPLEKGTSPAELTLQLMPSPTISGTVDAEGSPGASKVRVTLLKHQVIEGSLNWFQVNSQQTDAEGAFYFGDLQPGEYTVMSQEWEGDDPSYTQVSRQFPPRYIGDVRNLVAATKLHLRFGSHEQTALHLRAATYFPVRIPVQGQPSNAGINVRVAVDNNTLGYSLGWNARDGAVEGALPSGNYTLILSGDGAQGGFARVPFSVASAPLQHAPVTLAQRGVIPIHVHLNLTETDKSYSAGFAYNGRLQEVPTQANPVRINLISSEMGSSSGGNSTRHSADTEAVLENMAPGTYTVRVSTIRGYIASMTSGGTDLLRHPLVVGEGGTADPIDVTVRNDDATVTGNVNIEDQNITKSFHILLVAVDGSHMSETFAQRGSSFTIGNVPPGTYHAFALTPSDSQQLPYRDVAAMHAYDALGTVVTVAANQTTDIKLQFQTLAQAGSRD